MNIFAFRIVRLGDRRLVLLTYINDMYKRHLDITVQWNQENSKSVELIRQCRIFLGLTSCLDYPRLNSYI
jgi:hypothetical protein